MTFRVLLLTIALAMALLGASLAGPAQAAVVGLQRITLPASPSNSSNKGTTVSCPAGKKVLGAGGDTTPGGGEVLIEAIRPSADLKQVTVNAAEDQTQTNAGWYVQAFAICAQPPPGLARVTATSPSNSAGKSVSVSCPTGKRLLGTGAELSPSSGQVLLDEIRPSADLQSLTVNALEDENGFAGAWTVSAHAICANPVQGLVRSSITSALNSSAPKTVYAPCPAGKQLTGFGGDINSANGQIVLDAVFPPDLRRGGFSAWEDETQNAASWSLTAYAICANSAQRIFAEDFADSIAHKQLNPSCPAGKLLTGLGGEITGAFGQVVLDDLLPEVPPDGLLMGAFEDTSGFQGSWTIRAYGICATPLPGHDRFVTPGDVDSNTAKSTTVTCIPPRQVVGAGGAIAQLEPDGGQVIMDGIVPLPGLTQVRVSGAEDYDGTDSNWAASAFVICAEPPPGLQLVAAASPLESDEISRVTATCPAGKNLLGTGASISGGLGRVLLDDIRPNVALTSVTVTAIEGEAGIASNWNVTAYAICANP